jgi:hypothetical protein
MVAETQPDDTDRAAPGRGSEAARSNMQRMAHSLIRLAGIQVQLLLLRTKLTARKIILYALLMAGAAGAALLGMIFLFIGLFRALTSVLAHLVGHEWAPTLSCVICAVLLLGTALGMVLYAKGIFAGTTSSGEPPVETNKSSAEIKP